MLHAQQVNFDSVVTDIRVFPGGKCLIQTIWGTQKTMFLFKGREKRSVRQMPRRLLNCKLLIEYNKNTSIKSLPTSNISTQKNMRSITVGMVMVRRPLMFYPQLSFSGKAQSGKKMSAC